MRQFGYASEAELLNAEDSWLFKSYMKVSNKLNSRPKLPLKGEKNILVTSALPYVNDVPHLGDIFVSVLSADIFARYCRSRGWNTLHISGVDEHGPEIKEKALEENLTLQEMCDKYFEEHKKMYKWFNISFDMFGRTTSPKHNEFVQNMFKEIFDKGYITTGYKQSFYCEICNRTLDDQFVVGKCRFCTYQHAEIDLCGGCNKIISITELIEPRCQSCQQKLVVHHSRQIYFDPSKLETKTNNWMNNAIDDWSDIAKDIIRLRLPNYFEKILLTTDSKWGISIPKWDISVPFEKFKSKVFCNWFTSPISYMSITGDYTPNWPQWWKPKDETKITYYQFMAKDNVPIHSTLFPACLFATENNYTFVDYIMATDYIQCKHGKLSIDRGCELFGHHIRNGDLPADIFRFYLCYLDPNYHSHTFSWGHLININDTELLNNLGHFFNSTLSMVQKYFNYIVPEMQLKREEFTLLALVTRDLKEYINVMNLGNLGSGIRLLLSISYYGNNYIKSQNLCLSMKLSDKTIGRVGTNIGLCCNLACLLAIITQPFMPQTANKMALQLNIDISQILLNDFVPILLQPGHKMGKHVPLFKKLTHLHGLKCCIPDKSKIYLNQKRQKMQTRQKMQASQKMQTRQKIQTSQKMQTKQKIQTSQKMQTKQKIQTSQKMQTRQKNQTTNEKMLVVVPGLSLHHITSIKQMEEAISDQNNLIHLLKKSMATKKTLKPYNKVLMDMLKKLKQLKKTSYPKLTRHADNEHSQQCLVKEIKYKKFKQLANSNFSPQRNTKRKSNTSPSDGGQRKKKKIRKMSN